MSIHSLTSTHTFTLQRPTNASDEDGGTVKTFTAVTGMSGRPCTVQPVSARMRQAFAQSNIFLSHHLYTAFDTGAKNGDQVQVTGKPYPYRVVGMFDMAGRNRVFRLDLLELRSN